MGWIDTQDYVYVLVNTAAIGTELNWEESEEASAIEELKEFGLLEIAEKDEVMKLCLKRFV